MRSRSDGSMCLGNRSTGAALRLTHLCLEQLLTPDRSTFRGILTVESFCTKCLTGHQPVAPAAMQRANADLEELVVGVLELPNIIPPDVGPLDQRNFAQDTRVDDTNHGRSRPAFPVCIAGRLRSKRRCRFNTEVTVSLWSKTPVSTSRERLPIHCSAG